MKKIIIANNENINDVVELRVEMQIEDWNSTLNKDLSIYFKQFYEITKTHIRERLNKSLYFALMYLDEKPIAMCGIEELSELPQITICTKNNSRHCCIVSVYTKPQYRGNGYQQEVIKYLLDFAKKHNFNDITLTTDSPDAAHIYEKVGFKKISCKYFLEI